MTVIWAVGVVALDQLSKLLVIKLLGPYRSLSLIDDFLRITLTKNTGGAFGILQSKGLLVTVITVAISLALLSLLLFVHMRSIYLKIGLSLIAGGAVGNLIDRLRLGYVVDFLDFRIWPVFNLADVAIVFGTVLILLNLLRRG